MRNFKTKRLTVEERFWSKVDKTDTCWLWTGHLNYKGYGHFQSYPLGGVVRAHRFAWELKHGKIPDDKILCHSCDKRSCVNDAHMFLGTIDENQKDMKAKGRGRREKEYYLDWHEVKR